MATLQEQYRALCAQLQAGMELEKTSKVVTENIPKRIPGGVNTSVVQHQALVQVLIAKGIFTQAEYYATVIALLQAEVSDYQTRLSAALGRQVTL